MSGIYIPGMEMPKEGEWISVNISPDGICFIQSWCGKEFNFAEKLTAIPVSPHGVMSILVTGMEMPKNCFDCPLFDDVYTDADGDDDYSCGLGVPLDYYQASGETKKDCPLVPAADVRPVVRGHWIDGTCSNCGFFTDVVMSRFFSYCPNCGADMRDPPKEG